jgi:NADH:ubiquinone oxidoreductase subunit 5 (subunit L)/multisubunit Na+/H+ antiporter MnhA subunit
VDVRLFRDDGLGNGSYLIDAGGGRCVLVDPDRRVGRYLDAAGEGGLDVVAVLETHLHADFVSGALEVRGATGAELFVPAEAGVGFPHRPVRGGERVEVAGLDVEVLATPGHAPEHVAYVLRREDAPTDYGMLREMLPSAPVAAVAVGVIALLGGLLFKAGAVPAQFWVPDVTEGASPAVGAIVTTIPKIGAAVALYRLLAVPLGSVALDWALLVAVIAAVTMTLGNLAAFFQTDVRRLLAYSTISQIGYVLMAVAAVDRAVLALPSLLLYLAAYAVTNLGAFAVVCALPDARTLDDYTGLRRHRPWLAASLVVCLLGLVGTPPTGVFAGKLTVFTAAFDADLGWLVVVAAINTVASVFYYLRWITPMLRQNIASPAFAHTESRFWTAYVAAPVSVAVGLLAGPILTAVS